MSARTDLADALTEALPDTIRVVPYAATPDRIEAAGAVVLVYRERLAAGPTRAVVENTLRVWLLDARKDPDAVEDALDTNLDLVTAALDSIAPGLWESAERGVWAETYHGYSLAVKYLTERT